MSDAKLGTTPKGDEGRDAVHVAIVPVRAAESLLGGSPVKLNSDGEAEACSPNRAIGVVDPFMPNGQGNVFKGAWFWLCLYPKTITGLRHVWEHPQFPSVESNAATTSPTTAKQGSIAWLQDYVRKHCVYWEGESDGGYAMFLSRVEHQREVFYYGSDCHSLGDVEDADELFRHLSIVLDRRIDASYFEAFTCSC